MYNIYIYIYIYIYMAKVYDQPIIKACCIMNLLEGNAQSVNCCRSLPDTICVDKNVKH